LEVGTIAASSRLLTSRVAVRCRASSANPTARHGYAARNSTSAADAQPPLPQRVRHLPVPSARRAVNCAGARSRAVVEDARSSRCGRAVQRVVRNARRRVSVICQGNVSPHGHLTSYVCRARRGHRHALLRDGVACAWTTTRAPQPDGGDRARIGDRVGGLPTVSRTTTDASRRTSGGECQCSMPVLVSLSTSGGSTLKCQSCGAVMSVSAGEDPFTDGGWRERRRGN
jgi:hypothetical protein